MAWLPSRAMWIGVGLACLGSWWTWTRMSRYRYYEGLARTDDFSRCVRCGYTLEGLETEVCPECGTNSRVLVARARVAVGVDDPTGAQRNCE